jgi:NADH-quinone oxidoreductase subunit C
MLAPEEIAELLKSTFGDAVREVRMDSNHPWVLVAAEKWHDVALFLRDDSRLYCNLLRCISGVDRLADNEIEVVYDLMSMRPCSERAEPWVGGNVIAIKVRVPRDGGHIPTVSDVWPAADWHERETYDLLGVTFDNHPDHRRILCPDDWVGHPLRKDYQYPLEYHGIPASTEFGVKSPVH